MEYSKTILNKTFSLLSIKLLRTSIFKIRTVIKAKSKDLALIAFLTRYKVFIDTERFSHQNTFQITLKFRNFIHPFIKDSRESVDDHTTTDPYLAPLDFKEEDDRFSSDFETLQDTYNSGIFQYRYADVLKENHFFDYEYLVEGEDIFQPSLGEQFVTPFITFVVCLIIIFLLTSIFSCLLYVYFLPSIFLYWMAFIIFNIPFYLTSI